MLDLLPTMGPGVHRIRDNDSAAAAYSSMDVDVLLAYGSRSSRYFRDTCESLAHARTLETARASHNTANTAPARLVDPLVSFFADGPAALAASG